MFKNQSSILSKKLILENYKENKEGKKILFICKKRIDEYGKSYGLINSARFVSNYLNDIGFISSVVEVQNYNQIDKEVTLFNPDIVIVEAIWVLPKKFEELFKIKRHQKRKWVVRIHSRLTFLANEGIAMEWLNEYTKIQENYKNFIIAPNVKELTNDFSNIYETKFVFLPNIYSPDNYDFSNEITWQCDDINIGCFGAVRPMKNHLPQAVAAMEFASDIKKKLKFHINANRIEQKGEQVLKNLINLFRETKHDLVLHDWMNHKDFIALVKKMDMGMQVSLTETYNIVTADFVHNEVPIVVSKDVKWMPFISQANPNSTESIKEKLHLNYTLKNFGITKLNKFYLDCDNKKAKKIWSEFISFL
jgi:predicted nucleic-acid-binding protein